VLLFGVAGRTSSEVFCVSRELFCGLQVPVPNCPLSSRAFAAAPVSQSCLEPSDSSARFHLVAISCADLDFRFLLPTWTPRSSFSSVLLFDSISAALIFFSPAQGSLAPSCFGHWSLISGLVPWSGVCSLRGDFFFSSILGGARSCSAVSHACSFDRSYARSASILQSVPG
jgi:hypothetical protein